MNGDFFFHFQFESEMRWNLYFKYLYLVGTHTAPIARASEHLLILRVFLRTAPHCWEQGANLAAGLEMGTSSWKKLRPFPIATRETHGRARISSLVSRIPAFAVTPEFKFFFGFPATRSKLATPGKSHWKRHLLLTRKLIDSAILTFDLDFFLFWQSCSRVWVCNDTPKPGSFLSSSAAVEQTPFPWIVTFLFWVRTT